MDDRPNLDAIYHIGKKMKCYHENTARERRRIWVYIRATTCRIYTVTCIHQCISIKSHGVCII